MDFIGYVTKDNLAQALTYGPQADMDAWAETTVTGGTVLGEFYGISASPGASGSALVTTSADLNSVLAIASDYAGTSDILTIAVRTLSGSTSSSMFALIDWLELL